jgi:stringent starvation protein B
MPDRTTTKQRPYLIRAMHEWMVDNGLTPHIVADASHRELIAPREHVSDGKIVLNISFSATRGLVLGNDAIEFEARFGGVARPLSIPVMAVLGIYARETGQGMIFTEEGPPAPEGGPSGTEPDSRGEPSRPNLKVVK